ncbi:MAG: hypothetical protein H6656_21370 [Ardenticatenaceae bacterium]|nr:hypothetical protein [Anaerolineales bacterium]MCB9009885.1 hypothetical protein [Ardenticatenaceae bacterium]
MGRTLQTTTQLIQQEQTAFANFRRTLRRADQRHFDALFAAARLHTAAISQANHALPFEAVLLAMLLEQQKQIDQLLHLLNE